MFISFTKLQNVKKLLVAQREVLVVTLAWALIRLFRLLIYTENLEKHIAYLGLLLENSTVSSKICPILTVHVCSFKLSCIEYGKYNLAICAQNKIFDSNCHPLTPSRVFVCRAHVIADVSQLLIFRTPLLQLMSKQIYNFTYQN